MIMLWTELQALGSLYVTATSHLAGVFVLAVLLAAVLTTSGLDQRLVPQLQRTGLWGYTGALVLGLVSPL